MTTHRLTTILMIVLALFIVTNATAKDNELTVGYLKQQHKDNPSVSRPMLSGYLAGVMGGWRISQDLSIDMYKTASGSQAAVTNAQLMTPALNCIEQYDAKFYMLVLNTGPEYDASLLSRFVWSKLDECWYKDAMRFIEEKGRQ